MILANLLTKLVDWSARWKVVNSDIYTTQMYNYALIMVICGQKEFLGLRLKVLVLDRDSVENTNN